MSKKVSKEQYEKTLSFRFRQWLDGTKDPYLNEVEMQKQDVHCEGEEETAHRQEVRERRREKQLRTDRY